MTENGRYFLPDEYLSRVVPEYYHDATCNDQGTTFQPEIMPLAERLLAGSGRSRLIDVGTGNGAKLASAKADRKLGIDFGPNLAHCLERYPNAAEWRECDLGTTIPSELCEAIGKDDVVVCSDVIEHLPDPRPLLEFLRIALAQGALIITSTPERNLVRGAQHMGPPPNPAHVREWSLNEYRALLSSSGIPTLYVGLTFNNDRDRQLRTIVSLHEPRLQARFSPSLRRPLAIISTFNEEDIIEEVVEHWIYQGCDVHILDNWSSDNTWARVEALGNRFGQHLVTERFPGKEPATGSWLDILERKEEIAFCHKGRWIIHSDADEIRLSPFPSLTIADALNLVEQAGWNRVNFTVLNHRPVDSNGFISGNARSSLKHFEFGTKPGHFLLKKAWLQGHVRLQLRSSGGHLAEFPGAIDCPYHFILHHFPLRSVAHGRRKIFLERYPRWSEHEMNDLGWHHHYGEMASEALVWDPANLYSMEGDWWETHGLKVITGLVR